MNEYVVTWLKCTNDTFPLEPLLSCVLHAIDAADLQRGIVELLM